MRITPITPGSRPELAAQEQRILAERGRISPLYQVLLHAPAIAHGWEQMLSAVRNYNSLDAGLRELVILRVAVLNGAPYEFDAHVPHALQAGVSEAGIAATRVQPLAASPAWTPAQQLALEVTDALTCRLQVDDALYARVQQVFAAQQQVELFATVGAYNMVSRFLSAVQIGH